MDPSEDDNGFLLLVDQHRLLDVSYTWQIRSPFARNFKPHLAILDPGKGHSGAITRRAFNGPGLSPPYKAHLVAIPPPASNIAGKWHPGSALRAQLLKQGE